MDVQAIGCDFYAFSGHKIYGPTGTGVLYGRAALLDAMPPYQGGGDMIASVTFEKTDYNVLPYKFEAGTPNIAGVVGLGAALRLPREPRSRRRARRTKTPCWRTATARVRGMHGVRIVGEAARQARACCRSSSTASTRTTSARFSTPRASRSAPASTARSR